MQQTILDLLKPYACVLSKPQFNHFSRFIECLGVCDIPSISRFSAIHNKSRSSLNRFLTESPWEIESLKSVYRGQLKKYICDNSFLLIDDTISHRPYAKKVEKVNWHYDHTISKQSLGYSLVTSTIKSGENIVPYDIFPYYRKEDCEDREFMSKNDFAKRMILSTKNNDKIKLAIFDTWYSNDKVIGACKKAKKNYITQIKSNRNVTISFKKNAVRSFVKYIEANKWSMFVYKESLFRIFSTSAFISGVGSVHLVFSQMYLGKTKKWSDVYYIISDLLHINSQNLIETYLTRVGIEGFHREAKQNTGLEGYFLRNNRGIERYLFLVMIAYATLVLQSLSMDISSTIGEMCEENKIRVYESSFEAIKRNPELKEVIFKGLAKARV